MRREQNGIPAIFKNSNGRFGSQTVEFWSESIRECWARAPDEAPFPLNTSIRFSPAKQASGCDVAGRGVGSGQLEN